MKLLFISNLFPDEQDSVKGLDNVSLLHWLRKRGDFDIRVIAPRPVFPPPRRRSRAENKITARPIDQCFHPCYPEVGYIPKLGGIWNDKLYKTYVTAEFKRTLSTFSPQIVLVSWLFPDACAVTQLCANAGIPVVLITQGSDTHQYLNSPLRRNKIISAISRSSGVICRSGDLRNRLVKAGAPEEFLEVIYNGVDSAIFHPLEQREQRMALGLSHQNPILLFVGNLLPVKNPEFLLRAHAILNGQRKRTRLPPAKLVLIGSGPLHKKLEKLAGKLGTSTDCHFEGRLAPIDIAKWMGAADVLCLTSRNEGFPNVFLEAMACGLPIVSTNVGGISERITRPELGRLVVPKDMDGYVKALQATLESAPLRGTTEDLSWSSAASRYAACLDRAIAETTLSPKLRPHR